MNPEDGSRAGWHDDISKCTGACKALRPIGTAVIVDGQPYAVSAHVRVQSGWAEGAERMAEEIRLAARQG